jgi:hypothetical protein
MHAAFSPAPPRGTAKRKFTPEEDDRLTAIVNQLGDSNWKRIACYMGDRDCRQCRERWKNYLAPNVCKDPWTAEEDRLLQAKYRELGSQWAMIARFFPSRTDVNLKNRWVVLTSGTEKRVRRRKSERLALPEPTIGNGTEKVEEWSDGAMARFCDEAGLYDGDFSAVFGL